MTQMLADRANRRRWIVFAVLLAVSIVLMAFSSSPMVRDLQGGLRFAFQPIQGALDEAAGTFASIAGAITEMDRLRTDNEALEAENARLEAENVRLQEAARENEQLTALLQLRAGFEHETVAAAVISRDNGELQRVVGLDKGTDDGIVVGDVVIAAGGALVGRVTEAGPNGASVVLITDPTSTVIGQLAGSAIPGQVTGQLGDVLIMDQIDAAATIDLGVEVLTAGIELGGGVRSPYPKGLLIGQVIDVRRDANSVEQTAFLQPAAELDTLEYVLVITDYDGGLPPLIDQPIDCTPDESAEPDGSPDTLPPGEQPCLDPSASPSAAESPVPS